MVGDQSEIHKLENTSLQHHFRLCHLRYVLISDYTLSSSYLDKNMHQFVYFLSILQLLLHYYQMESILCKDLGKFCGMYMDYLNHFLKNLIVYAVFKLPFFNQSKYIV